MRSNVTEARRARLSDLANVPSEPPSVFRRIAHRQPVSKGRSRITCAFRHFCHPSTLTPLTATVSAVQTFKDAVAEREPAKVVPTVSAVLKDGSILEMLHDPEEHQTRF